MKMETILNNFEIDMKNYMSNEKEQKWQIIKALLINASDDDVLSLINYYQREIMCECEFVHKSHLNFLLESIFTNTNMNDYLDLLVSLTQSLETKYYGDDEIFFISEDNEIFCYENVENLLDNIYLDDVVYTLFEDLSKKDIAILEAIKDIDSLIGCWEMSQ